MAGIIGAKTIDPDTGLFLRQTNISSDSIVKSLNTFVTELKDYGVWNSMIALYPFIGGTESTCMINLKDPRDTNDAFRLKFFGGWTHSPSGSLPNGIDGYAETYLNVSASLTPTNLSYSYYVNSTFTPYDPGDFGLVLGAYASNSNALDSYYNSSPSRQLRIGGNINFSGIVGVASPLNRGYYGVSRTASNFAFVMREDGTTNSSTSAGSVTVNKTIWIGYINGLASFNIKYMNQRLSFLHVGDGLSETEMTNLRTAVIKFQTALGRNI